MKAEDISQIKNDFTSFFQQIQDLISENNRFKEIIEDYIDCKHTIDQLREKNDKNSKLLLRDYLSVQKDLETEIFSQLNRKKSKFNYKIKGRA